MREIAVAIRRSLKYRILEAADGKEAPQIFGAHAAEVDLLVVDVVLLGKMRGRGVAERIAASKPNVKVLFIAGCAQNSIVHHGSLDEGVHPWESVSSASS